MNSIQLVMSNPGIMESSHAPVARPNNPVDLQRSNSTSFKERLDQANRRFDNSDAGDTEVAESTSSISDQENAVEESQDKPERAATKENRTVVDESGQDDENTSAVLVVSQTAPVENQVNTVLIPVEALLTTGSDQMKAPVQQLDSLTGQEGMTMPVIVDNPDVLAEAPKTSGTIPTIEILADGEEILEMTASDNSPSKSLSASGAKGVLLQNSQTSEGRATHATRYMTAAGQTITSSNSGQEQSKSEIRKVLEMEGQRSTINRLNVQQVETTQDTGSESQTSSDDTQSSLSFNLAELAVSKMPNRDVLPASLSHAQATVDAQDLMNQVVQKAELMLKQDSSEMTIQLKPGFLGKMTIKILVDDGGTVTAQFTTSSQQVKNMLEQNLQTLRQNLEAQGMKVDKAEVNVQLDSGGMLGDFGGRQQELWQQASSRSFNASGRYYDVEVLESVLDNDSTIYPSSYESRSDDGFNFLV